MTMYLFKLITLFGGLALFLFGMDVMGKALERTAGADAPTVFSMEFLLTSFMVMPPFLDQTVPDYSGFEYRIPYGKTEWNHSSVIHFRPFYTLFTIQRYSFLRF